jgi:Trk K+ transport system NAD-binding subunit
LIKIGLKDLSSSEQEAIETKRPIVMLGVYKIATSFIDRLSREKSPLLNEIMVVDFNPIVKAAMKQRNIPYVYADISHPDTLLHVDISHASIIVCSIENVFLKGTTNLHLVETLNKICPNAKIIVTGDDAKQSLALYRAGADVVLQPSKLTSEFLTSAIERATRDEQNELQQQAIQELENHNEFL